MKLTHKFIIDIDVFYEFDDSQIAATKIVDIRRPDGTIDEQALSDYLNFIEQTLYYLEEAGLEIVDMYDSKSSRTSKYITLVDKKQHETDSQKYIIELRISDHTLNLTPAQSDWVKQRRHQIGQSLHAKWKLRKITVNKNTYLDYDDASEAVEKLAIQYANSLHNK